MDRPPPYTEEDRKRFIIGIVNAIPISAGLWTIIIGLFVNWWMVLTGVLYLAAYITFKSYAR